MTATDARSDPRIWLLDVNVLVALALANHVHHRAALRAWRQRAGGWATCSLTESALLRLLLNPAVAGRALAPADVLGVLRGLRADARWRFLADDVSLAGADSDSGLDLGVLHGHRQVTDLHLVALAARHDAVLVTFDAALSGTLAPPDRRHVLVLPQ